MNQMPGLKLYKEYSRQDVHDIFSPETSFTPVTGVWGLRSIVEIPGKPGDFIFFATFGQKQSGHTFDEWITEEGEIFWRSESSQTLLGPRTQQFIHHNEKQNTIYLFLRTKTTAQYTYLGSLKYLSHDLTRERPVYIYWQLLDWPIPTTVLTRIGLKLQPSDIFETGGLHVIEPEAAYTHNNKTFGWRGTTWEVNLQELNSEINDWIKRGLPVEATSYKDWYIEVAGQRISPKWIFHLITGADYSEFDAPVAREKLSKIGFHPMPVQNSDNQANNSIETDDLFSLIPSQRKLALDNFTQFVQNELETRFQLDRILPKMSPTSLELHFADLKDSYRITFLKTAVEVGYFFPGKSHKARLIVDQLNQHADEISPKLGYVVKAIANSWQPWGKFGFEIPILSKDSILLTPSHTSASITPLQVFYADALVRFVEVTFGLVQNVTAQDFKTYLSSSHQKAKEEKLNSYSKIIETKIEMINQVLTGTAAPPTDEVLCDWVHFCYDFGLYKEGQMLFTYVTIELVNPWYFERTKKVARLCSMKANAKD